ncbi:hypothetical protein FJY71_03155 [candidate division WOR-3 bacterium]|nr:hypothetical protein [candidate division WOR-3 bacterium]
MLRLVLPAILGVTAVLAEPPVLSEFPIDTTLVSMPWRGSALCGLALASDGTNSLVVGSHGWNQGAARIDRDCGVIDYTPASAPGIYPAVAFSGTRWLAVGTDNSGVSGARYTQAGALIDTFITISRTPDTRAAVGAGNGSWLVVWADPDVRAARVDAGGNVLDTAGLLICDAPGEQAEPAVAFDGTNWLVVWHDLRSAAYYDIYACRVSPAGQVLDPGGFVVSNGQYSQLSPAVAWDGRNFVVAWQDYRSVEFDIYAARVTSSGTVLDPNGIMVAEQAIYQRFPAVASGLGRTLLLWERWDSAGCSGIWGARLDTAGNVLDPDGFVVAPAGEGEASLTFDGSRFVAAWRDTADYQLGSWIDTSGYVGFPAGRPVCAGVTEQTRASVASDGSRFLVAWTDEKSGDTADIRAMRVDSLGRQLDASPMTISAAPRTQFWPVVGGRPAGWLVAWYDSRATNWALYCCRVTSEGIPLDSAGIAVCSTASVSNMKPAVAWCGTGWLVAWDDRRTTNGGVYAARVNTSGHVLDPEGFRVIDSSNTARPSVCSDGSRWLVAVERGGKVLAAFVDPAGYAYPPFRVSPASGSGWISADVAFDGSGFLVAYTRIQRELFAARVDPLGNVLDTAGITTGVSTIAVPSAVPSREGWLVAGGSSLIAAPIRGATIAANGTVLDTFTLPYERERTGWPELAATASRRAMLVYTARPGELGGRMIGDARRIYGAVEPFLGIAGGTAPGTGLPVLAVSPSVFRSRAHIEVTVSSAARVRLRIFDRSGRLVRTLLDARAGPGAQTALWTGTDDSGRRLPSGVYVCRLELDGRPAANRAVVLH